MADNWFKRFRSVLLARLAVTRLTGKARSGHAHQWSKQRWTTGTSVDRVSTGIGLVGGQQERKTTGQSPPLAALSRQTGIKA